MTKRNSNITKTRTRAKKKSTAASAQNPITVKRPGGKLGLILERLEAKKGATIDDLVTATGWQKHSVHGALSRLRTGGFTIRHEAVGAGRLIRFRRRIVEPCRMWRNTPAEMLPRERTMAVTPAQRRQSPPGFRRS